jgi:hypothetical protein
LELSAQFGDAVGFVAESFVEVADKDEFVAVLSSLLEKSGDVLDLVRIDNVTHW